MKARALLMIAAFAVSGCTQFMVNTNFHMLQRGITKQQFINTWQRTTDAQRLQGGSPAASQMFKLGDDVWEVWIYNGPPGRLKINGCSMARTKSLAIKGRSVLWVKIRVIPWPRPLMPRAAVKPRPEMTRVPSSKTNTGIFRSYRWTASVICWRSICGRAYAPRES
jgi:hypothetical protein